MNRFLVVSILFLSALIQASSWVNVNKGMPTNIQIVAAVPGQNKLVAFGGVQSNGAKANLWSSVDNGQTWQALGTSGKDVYVYALGVLFDKAHPDTFWLWGNYDIKEVGGTYITTDGGRSFNAAPADVNLCGYCEDEGLSVDFGDPQRRTIVVGNHEQVQGVRLSTDGAKSWKNIGGSLPGSSAKSQYPLVIDANTFLMGCSFTVSWGTGSAGGTPGVYRTEDQGKSWSLVSNKTVFQAPLVVGDTIYWMFYNGNDGGIIRSLDKGKTWKETVSSGLAYTAAPIRLPDGALASLNNNHQIVLSRDGGTTWVPFEGPSGLNDAFGVTFNEVTKTFFVWQKALGRIQRLDGTSGVLRTDAAATRPGSRFRIVGTGSREGSKKLVDLNGRPIDPARSFHGTLSVAIEAP